MLSLTRILIASDDSVFTRALSSAIESSAQLSITGIYSSGDGLTDTILHEQPDALLIDLMIPGINAFSLLKELHDLPAEQCPVIFVLSSFASPHTVAECDRLGVSFFLRKPVDLQALVELITRYGCVPRRFSSDSQQPSAHDISRRVTQIISSLQLPAHVAGYRYARECILMTLEDPSVADSVTKILYPAVARKYHTTWTSVERDIRNAVEIAWKRSGGRMAGFSSMRRPPNRELILTIADRVRYELHLDNHRELADEAYLQHFLMYFFGNLWYSYGIIGAQTEARFPLQTAAACTWTAPQDGFSRERRM